MVADSTAPDEQNQIPVRFEYTPTFPQILEHLKSSLLVTTYQAGKVLVLGAHQGKLTISFMSMEQPMGLAVSPSRIAIGSRRQIHFLVPAHETQSKDSPHDGCFVPRSSFYSGAIHGHDLAWGEGGLWAVNTLFSCLSTLHPSFSFVPQWRPPFISQLIDQDRCHLNGLAMDAGRPRYVTVLGETDQPAGWRENKVSGGAVLEVPSGQVVYRGLCMPHSPRVSHGRLFVLNSGLGHLCQLDHSTGRLMTIESLPGYTRGLALSGQFAFVGLSKIRETNIFGGLPIGERPDELRCGVGAVDLTTGRTVATFQFHSGVEEIFAVELLPGFANPLLAGASLDERQQEVWIVPHEQMPRPQISVAAPIFADEQFLAQEGTSISDSKGAEQLLASAVALRAAGQLDQAANCLDRAASLTPNPVNLLIDLGNLRQEQGQQQAARLCYERALTYDPQSIAAQQNLGYLAFNLGMAEESAQVLDRLLAQQPSPINHLLAASVLPVVYDSLQDIQHWKQRSLTILNQAAERGLRHDASETLVPTFFFSAYTGDDPRELLELRGRMVHGRDYTSGRVRWTANSGRAPRIGFLSAYFRDHTIGRLNIGRIESPKTVDADRIVIQAGRAQDWMVDRFRKAADEYVELPRDVPSAIEALRVLELDILVFADIGMDSLATTLAFSRFAPVQAVTWGHPMTTGSTMMDYFLSSPDLEVAQGASHYTEKLLLLDSLGLNYQRPDLSQSNHAKTHQAWRCELNLPEEGRLYGCPQTLFKFHPDFDQALAGILETDPSGLLVLIDGRVPRWTSELQRRFRRTLPQSGRRVRFLPSLPNTDFLKLLAVCDVLQDPFPYGG
ncbi:MAG TPA: TIGR03032 family protein, partial [Planctomycetaceae bacterium]|nr:TIGR03032 family protein [Planctomycetaceae bacterium]